MSHKPKIKKIILMLVTSKFYFDLPLPERLNFVKNIVRKHSGFLKKPVSFRGVGVFVRSGR